MENALLLRNDLATALDSLLQLLAPKALGNPPVRIQSAYAKEVADQVLAATDLEDLGERLDCLAGDEALWEQITRAEKAESWENIRTEIEGSKLDTESLNATLGPTATRRCEQGQEAIKTIVRRGEGLVAELKAIGSPSSGSSDDASIIPRHDRVIDYLYDLRVPASLRHGLMLLLRTAVATIVIGRAEEHGKKLEPWLALGLANSWAEAPERLAGFLGDTDRLVVWLVSMVPEMVTSQGLRAAFEAWELEALSTGQGIFFPLDPDRAAD